MTPDELARRLTEREFRRLHIDSTQRPLGQRRIELLLAQLTFHVCRTWGGGQDSTIGDYLRLVDALPEDEDEEDLDAPVSTEEAQAVFGFNPKITKKEHDHVEQPGSPGGPAGP